MKKFLALSNLLVILAVIAWNYLANSANIKGNTVGSLSDEYFNLFTPAGYAFIIWGPIFLGLLALGIYGVVQAFRKNGYSSFLLKMGPWLIIANLGNAAWLWFWLNEQTGISVIIMLIILISLIVLILRLNMERWDAPLVIIANIWWPLCLYSGWIAVATVANISAYLAKIEWSWLFGEVTWTLIMIILAAGINLFMILTRNMREFAAVGIWALLAIAVRHWDSIPAIQYTALASAIVISIVVSIHAYKNRDTNPFLRVRQPSVPSD